MADVSNALQEQQLRDQQEQQQLQQHQGEGGEYPVGPFFDSSYLQIETYEDLTARRDEIFSLMIAQGDGACPPLSPFLPNLQQLTRTRTAPELQEASVAAVDRLLENKASSWSILLRRSFQLYSNFCIARNLPTFPITGPKVAFYLVRLDATALDGDGNPLPPLPAPSGEDAIASQHQANGEQDLTVPNPEDEVVDPALGGSPSTSHFQPAAPVQARGSKTGTPGPRPKKVLRRKTLEQYVNRLTTLRAATLLIWRNRTGAEGAGTTGLGIAPVIKEVFTRAGGEGSQDVKKRQKATRGKGIKPTPKAKGKAKRAEDDNLQLGADLEVHHGSGSNVANGVDAAVAQSIRHFAVASDADGTTFNILVDPTLSHDVSPFINTSFASSSTSSHAYAPATYTPATSLISKVPVGETYTLSEEDFHVALSYIKSLSGRGIEQRIGEIARSVEAAAVQGVRGAFDVGGEETERFVEGQELQVGGLRIDPQLPQ